MILDQKPADELDVPGVGRSTVKDVLRKLVEAGQVTREGTGKRGDAYRYWRPAGPEFDSAEPTVDDLAERNGAAHAPPEMLSARTPTPISAESNHAPRPHAPVLPGCCPACRRTLIGREVERGICGGCATAGKVGPA